MMRFRLVNSSSVKLAVPSSSSFKNVSLLCPDLSFSYSEISFFNTVTSAHMLAVASSSVGVVDYETTAHRIHRTDCNHDIFSRLQAFLLRGDVSIP